MKRTNNKYALLVAVLGSTYSLQGATVSLISEKFTSGTSTGSTWTSASTQQWVFSSPDASATGVTTEVWTGTGGASARGLATTYDHDNNVGTTAIDIPGGIEVMSGFTGGSLPDTIRVTVTTTLPIDLDFSSVALFTFFTENRISGGLGGNAPRFGIFNITDNREIIPLTAPNQPTSNWNFQNPTVNFIAADVGDTIELRFEDTITSGGSGGARGLQIADVNFSVQTIPEPSVAVLGGLSLLGIFRRRR